MLCRAGAAENAKSRPEGRLFTVASVSAQWSDILPPMIVGRPSMYGRCVCAWPLPSNVTPPVVVLTHDQSTALGAVAPAGCVSGRVPHASTVVSAVPSPFASYLYFVWSQLMPTVSDVGLLWSMPAE